MAQHPRFDVLDTLIREDGGYGPLYDEENNPVTVVSPVDGLPVQLHSILDLDDAHTRIYEVHHGLTQAWASQLIGLGYPADLALEYDREAGAVEHTLGELAAAPPGTAYESFHFVLNNTTLSDNRIPTYRMRYDIARQRNVLPVPASLYGDPGPGGEYRHWDEVVLDPPASAARAEIALLYQPTSWEYFPFLALANDGSVAFLADEGANMLEAWIETGMATPHEMASLSVAVPEPSELLMLGIGSVVLLGLARRRGAPEKDRLAGARGGSACPTPCRNAF